MYLVENTGTLQIQTGCAFVASNVVDPDPGLGKISHPGWGKSGSGINIPDT